MLRLDHLTLADHAEAARLLAHIQSDLTQLATLVNRAPFSGATLRVQARIQETLIEPLREALSARADGPGNARYPASTAAAGRAR